MTDQVMSGAPQGTPEIELDPHLRIVLAHADDNMVIAQRLAELISHAPELEIDIAVGNTALDHLGVARALYTHAGELEGEGRSEDEFAMRRTERQYLNLLIVEQPNGDFAHTIVRQVFFDAYQRLLWADLGNHEDQVLGGISAKAAKEAAYHFEFSSSWLVRLGDGTEESHNRAQEAVDDLWRFTTELAAPYASQWRAAIDGILDEARLKVPDDPYQRSGGRQGYHTAHLGFLLAEMQWLDRSYPGLEW